MISGLLGFGPGRRTRRRPYQATTRHAQAAFPFIADASLGADGALIGHDTLGRAFCYDPFILYERGLLNSPNTLILGDIGYGKSALVKTYLYRQAVFGHIPVVVDVKGEYDRLAAALGVAPIRFAAGGRLRLNPLDPAVAGDARHRLLLLRSLVELLTGRALTPREGAALEQATDQVTRAAETSRRQPAIGQLIDRLLDPAAEAAAELRTTSTELRDWGYDVALSLRRLTGTGDLAGLFDGPTSPELDLTGPAVIVNLHQVSDAAKPLLMACVAAWLRGVWARADGRRRIVVQEEAWHLLTQPSIAELQQMHFKLARAYGVQNLIVLHHLGDLRAAGDAGSRTQALAAGLLADAATRILYHLDEGEAAASAELLSLNHAQQQLLPYLQRTSALWLVGQRPFVVHHRLAPDPSREAWLVDTDQAMRGSAPSPGPSQAPASLRPGGAALGPLAAGRAGELHRPAR